jgi:hygromycin-B 4-O-kinase
MEIGEALGGFYAVSERVHGRFLNALTGDEMRACLPGLLATLDAARRADVSASSGYGVWDATGNAPHASWADALTAIGVDSPTHRTHGWRERMAASHVGIGQFDEALACLRSLAASMPAGRHLLHNDLLASNVFVEGDRITGVIDWGCGMYGDFLYDLALLAFWAQWLDGWRGIDFAAEAERYYGGIELHVPRFRERLRCYQMYIGLDACAYMAFRGRWSELETATRQLQLLLVSVG